MPLYNYVAKDFSGQKISGVLEADNLQNFYQALKERELFCLEVSQKHQPIKISSLSSFGRKPSNKLSLKDLAVFCRQFHVLLLAGVTVIKALDVIYQQTESKNCKAVVLKVYETVQKGDLLSEAMRKQGEAFPTILINMIESGEASGKLDLVLQKMAEHFDKERKLRTKLLSAMIYPVILSIVTVAVVIILFTFVMPTFIGLFESSGVELPLPTRILIGLSKFVSGFWYIILLGIVTMIYSWFKYIKTEKGRLRWDGAKLKIPVFKSVAIKVICARLTRTLSILLSSGIPLLNCLEITSRVLGNKVVADGLLVAKEDMSKGSSISQAIRRVGVFPAMIYSMINIGEESGSLEGILDKTSVYYDEEVDVALQRLLAIFEPLMIIIMATIVGFIVVSIAMAMFKMYSTI